MTEPAYGLVFNLDDTDPRPSQPSDLSVIGLVLPADDADVATFPLNEPVAFDTGDPTILPKIGATDLAWAVNAIDAQLADLQTSARVVFVRVAKGVNDAATIANIIGSPEGVTTAGNTGTGIYALLRAGAQCGVIPRLIGSPGYTWQTTAGNPNVSSAAKTGGNTGNGTLALATPAYLAGVIAGVYKVIFTDATHFTVTDPDGNEVGTGVAGTAFATQIGFTITAGATAFVAGDEFDITVNGVVQANPICAALPQILNTLLAHAVVGAPGTGQVDAVNWFETLASQRLIAIDAWRVVSIGVGTRQEDGVAAVLGLGARVDFQNGGYPFKSFSGQQVQGTVGLKNYFAFSLTDGATTGQELLATHIGVIERGEIGVETAIASNGFVFAGVWSAGTDPNWWFYNKTRARDWIHLALLKSIRLRLGVQNVTPHSVQAVLNDMVVVNQDALQQEGSIGFKVGFEAAKNSPDALRQGQFRVFFAAETPAPITKVTIDSRPYYQALIVELGTLVAQAATLPAQFLQ